MDRKVVFITGASSGIGKRTAVYFHERGWRVAATMRNPDAAKDLDGYPGIRRIRLDVTDLSTIRDAAREAIGAFGRIDVVVNNAAYSLTGAFEAGSPEQIEKLFTVDVFGVMNVIREVLPYFRKAGSGGIINISSLGGLIGMPLSSFYASAKWAVEGFSESLRFELDKLGIWMKIVEPGAIRTNFADNAVIVRKHDVPEYEEIIEKRLAAYESRRTRLNDPVVVSKVIYRAATDRRRRKLRYLAGNDAELFWGLRRILPFSVFSSLLRRMAG